MSTRRPTISHRLEFAAFRAVEKVLAGMNMEDCVSLGRGIGTVIYGLSGKYRRIVRNNLRIVTGANHPTPDILDAMVRETFRRGASNFIAALKTQVLPKDQLGEFIEFDEMERLNENYRAGHGSVVVMPHMGNWEALTQLRTTCISADEYAGVYRPLDNPLMDDLTRERRTSDGAILFSRKDGFHAPAAVLRRNGVLGVLADQRAGGRGIAMPFFGKMTTCSPLPNLMARRGKARVTPLGILTTGTARWKITVKSIDDGLETEEIMAALEAVMSESLTDVFWFHDRWRTDPSRPLSFFTKLDPSVAANASVPLRLILTTPPGADENGVQAMLAAMLELRPDLCIDRLITPGARAEDPRIILHEWDPTAPPEQCDSLIGRLDHSQATPLDGALLFGSEPGIARAARRHGLRPILGFDVKGKPWSRSFPAPSSKEDWAGLAEKMARVPKKHRS